MVGERELGGVEPFLVEAVIAEGTFSTEEWQSGDQTRYRTVITASAIAVDIRYGGNRRAEATAGFRIRAEERQDEGSGVTRIHVGNPRFSLIALIPWRPDEPFFTVIPVQVADRCYRISERPIRHGRRTHQAVDERAGGAGHRVHPAGAIGPSVFARGSDQKIATTVIVDVAQSGSGFTKEPVVLRVRTHEGP